MEATMTGTPTRPETAGVWVNGRPTPAELGVIDWLLTTTRAVRRSLDLTRPVAPEVIEECLRIALQAPTAHNEQRWHWLVVTDPAKRALLADAYQRSWDFHSRGVARRGRRWAKAGPDADRTVASAEWLPEHLAAVPVHVIPCIVGPRPEDLAPPERPGARAAGPMARPRPHSEFTAAFWGSIYPAVWSFQLALRSRGLGSVLTCMHLAWEDDIAEALGIPDGVTQTCLLPVAHTTKTVFQPARRAPLERRISWNGWQGVR